jgi:hypothetical protein
MEVCKFGVLLKAKTCSMFIYKATCIDLIYAFFLVK